MSNLPERIIALEADVQHHLPPTDDEPAFTHIAGSVPILLSAPHATVHIRDGRAKPPEEFTAGFVRFIANQTGAHALYTRRRLTSDPNWHSDSPYKHHLKRIVRDAGVQFVLDVHGASSARWKFGIAVGTINGRSCPQHERDIVETLAVHGFNQQSAGADQLVLNHPRFTGGTAQETVTRYACDAVGVPAAQFELTGRLLWITGPPDRFDPERLKRAVDAFVALVHTITDQQRTYIDRD